MTNEEKLHIPRKAKTDDRRTPDSLYQRYNRRFKFTIDLAASLENTKCKRFYCKEKSSLKKNWFGSCWLNPPYDQKNLELFVKKALEQQKNYRWCVMLLPAKTDQFWWHELWARYISHDECNIEIEWIKGRVRFEGPGCNTCAFIPNVVVILKGKKT